MVIIYTTKTSARLQYILDELFRRRSDVDFQVTQNAEEYARAEGFVRINYTDEPLPGMQIIPSGLLEENTAFTKIPCQIVQKNALYVLFENEGHDLGYDIFSMAFWFLSRMEEYRNYTADEHGRFEANQSLLFDGGHHKFPILDIALNHFYEKLGIDITNKYNIFPTIDIDIAYKHKGKNAIIWILSLARNLVAGNVKEVGERIRVLFGDKDPWDTYDYLNEVLMPLKSQVRFFVHAGQRSKYDKPVKLSFRPYRKALLSIKENYEIGIHPDYIKGQQEKGIVHQKQKLEKALGIKITRSRHHFLRIHVPTTYPKLNHLGIAHDYTMGYSSDTGFRAGTAQSFRFFDLNLNCSTPLLIHPFCMMDVTLKNSMALSFESAKNEIQRLKNVCQENKTPFCFIFHNESVSNEGEWRNYQSLFELCLK